ncbi:MAG: glycosyltransferase family A protein, partial [Anaerolineales bacterium]
NPARNRVSDYKPARVTAAVIVYLPHLTGYFQHRLDVVRLSFETLMNNTREPFDLLVFDNASCAEVKAYLSALQSEGRIRYLLTSSENIGKLGALRVISGAAPGELIAYADDDTFFYPGWLRAHLDIFDHFPGTGMVSGSPERTLFDHGIQSNLRVANSDQEFTLEYGKRVPMQWEREWATALGKDVENFLSEVEGLQDITLQYKGKEAYATACHNQFLSPKSVMQEHLGGEWSGRLMGGLNEFDEAIDTSGLLRLTTMERTTKLIGNVVSPEMASEARSAGVQVGRSAWQPGTQKSGGFLQRAARKGPLRWFLQGVYNRLFWILTGQSGEWVEPESEE